MVFCIAINKISGTRKKNNTERFYDEQNEKIVELEKSKREICEIKVKC